MTPKKTTLYLASILFLSEWTQAEALRKVNAEWTTGAQVQDWRRGEGDRRGDRGGGRREDRREDRGGRDGRGDYGPVPAPYPGPPPIRPVRPVRPAPPRYVPVTPERPWNPQRPGGPGHVERQYEYLGQIVHNTEIPLRALFNIGRDFAGYSVDSLQVEVASRGHRFSKLSLEVNGRSVDSEYDPQGWVTLDPGLWDQIGTEIRTLRLDVRGQLYIGGIYINLRRHGDAGRPGGNEPDYQTIQLEVPGYLLPRRMLGNDRLGLGQLINFNDYVGYKVQEIVIEGEAIYNNAILDIVVNGVNVGPSMVFGSHYGQVQFFRPSVSQSLGYGYDSILLLNRGDLNIRRIILRLSRW